VHYPGVDVRLLKLLIGAKGYSQRGAGEPPRILLTGQSSAGKTAHALLAAEIACDRVATLKIGKDEQRFMTAFCQESERNGYVFLDEIAKAAVTVNAD